MKPENLLILPFDHRSSFSKKILGIEGTPSPEDAEKIKDLKRLVFEAFLRVRSEVENPHELGILVDEQYGAEILKEARKLEITTCTGVEKSGQSVFDFEYGRKFGSHIEALDPDYVKVLVRYNPEDNPGTKRQNRKQIKRLTKLSIYCQRAGYKLLFELLVPPTEEDLNSDRDFETEIRPEKTATAIEEISQKVKAHLWKLEGFTSEGWRRVLEVVPEDEHVIVLGRGEDAEKVRFWLEQAAQFDQIIGFAVGRTIFMKPLLDHLRENKPKDDAIKEIAENYKGFIQLWRSARNDELTKR